MEGRTEEASRSLTWDIASTFDTELEKSIRDLAGGVFIHLDVQRRVGG